MPEVERVQPGDDIHVDRGEISVNRYGPAARVNHWITAASLILLAVSGLALFYPSLYFLTALFGGGQNTRALHPYFGVVLFVSFFVFFMQLWRANLPTWVDVKWVSQIGDVVSGREDRLPEVGKYNAGQKFIFWSMAFFIVILIVTGAMVWQAYFAPFVPIDTQRIALLVHAIAAVLIICVFILHVYAGIWTRGTLRAMTRGTVTGGWAWRHHRKWLKELAAKRGADPAE